MPIPVINPVDGDDLHASSITVNVTDKIVAWAGSHETGVTTNGSIRHLAGQIDDGALPETTIYAAAMDQHGRNDTFASSISAIAGGSATGYAARIAALAALPYRTLTLINTELATNATASATGSQLVRRRTVDGSADFGGTSNFASIAASATIVAAGNITGQNIDANGLIFAGSGNVQITTALGNLDATTLSGALPSTSMPALTGDVTTVSGTVATTVGSVGGKTAAAVAGSVAATTAASGTAVANHGNLAKYDAAGGMTFDGPVVGTVFTATTFSGTATAVPASGITGTVAASQIDAAIARAANVPTNAGVGAIGTWSISISGSAALAAAATDLAAGTVLGVPKGGTGLAILPSHALLAGNGTGSVTTIIPGVSGTVLVSDGTTWSAGVVTVPDFSLTTRKLLDGAVVPYTPATLHVAVNSMKKFDGAGNPVQWNGGDLDLSSYVPGSGTSVWVLVYLNATAAVYAAQGQASATPQKPQAIGGQTPLAYVLMYAGMSQITTADIYEWRTDFAAFAVGGGTGSGYSAVGHIHGQGGESFVAVTSTDEGRVTAPNVPGMTVYVQPTRYSDANAVVQQFPGGPSATIVRPVSNPYLAAIGLSQTGSVTISYGAEATTPLRGPFLNATDIPLAYILVRPTSTRTILNDDSTNALIIDARRTYTYASPAASGVSGVTTGGSGQSSFIAGILISPGGTAPYQTIPGLASATVGMAVTPTVSPAGLDADGFQIGPVTVATTGTNITNYRSMHLLSPTKTGTGTIANMYGVYIDGPTIAGTTTTIANYIKTGTTGTIGMVVDTVAAPTGNLQELRANGTVVGAVSAVGAIGQGGTASANVAFFQSGTFASVSSSAWAFAQNTILKPSGAGGSAAFAVIANTGTVDTSAAGGAVAAAYGVLVNPVNKTGANAITNAYGAFINIPTAGTTNTGLAFNAPAGAIQQEAWTAPTLLNSWVNSGAGSMPSGYFKDTQGVVHVRGEIKSGTTTLGTALFTAASGYRASAIASFPCAGNSTYAEARIDTAGGVYIYAGGNANLGLNAITYDTR